MHFRKPDQITLQLEDSTMSLTDSLLFNGGQLTLEIGECIDVYLSSKAEGVSFITFKWNITIDPSLRCLGDAWERGYGDLEWRTLDPSRMMPWYFALSNGSDSCLNYERRLTKCFGVGVRPNSFALWSCGKNSVTLTLDLRNGCQPVKLGDRVLHCATIYYEEYRNCSAFEALTSFCAVMCKDPILPDHPVYGSNNWYYAYGNSSHREILEDTRFVSSLCHSLKNKPYMVIDDGWQPNNCDAPWDSGNERFPNMKALANEMKSLGVRPGIWIRPLINGTPSKRYVSDFSKECYLSHTHALDPSHPEVLCYVKSVVRQLRDWGYTLIKHDYSTFDIFGKWGFQFMQFPAEGDWHFYDQSKTSAEIVKEFYLTIQNAVPETIVIGCNTFGHLCAGIHQLQRTGDDTSGFEWARTLKMGVNTLAFRLVQNRTFFIADADCAGITPYISWKKNQKWLEILSRSGSCLFVSCKSDTLKDEALTLLEKAYLFGSEQADILIPLDWMEHRTPKRFLINGKECCFEWDSTESG